MSAVITPRLLGANMIDVLYPDGTLVLFSYRTPVAARVRGADGYIRTDTNHSNATGRHISAWMKHFGAVNPRRVPQETIAAIASCSPEVWALRDAIRELGA